MPSYLSPDVYVENNDNASLNIEASVGVAAMVGTAARGPINEAQVIRTWNQYINAFAFGMDSPFVADSDLAYSVYGFFQNGGSECVIVRTAHETHKPAESVAAGGFSGSMTAKDSGEWGNNLSVTITANNAIAENFDIAVMLSGNVVENLINLSNEVDNENYWMNRVNVESSFITGVSGDLAVTTAAVTFTGGENGLSDITDDDYINALQAFKPHADSISYVAIPGQTTGAVLAGILEYCYYGSNIIPILEAPKTANTAAVQALRKNSENFTGVLVWPWGNVTDPLSKAAAPNNIRACPPSGHYMGVLARIANKRGMWKAPAGTEATVKGFISCVTDVTEDDTDILNPIGVVSIKSFTNYGVCVWGARTLNSTDPNFRYISDLVLDAYIKRQCYILGLPYVFEGNQENTWVSLQTVVAAFMDNLMLQGAFASNIAANAYYVKCDSDLNDPHVAKNDGIIEVEVGYAGVKPGEFIVFKIAHNINND